MIENLFYVILGISAGTVCGLLPGVGILVSLVLLYPLTYSADPYQLMLLYMSLAAIVQFTGTIPSIYIGMPGESNSIPSVIEGTKFMRHNQSNLAVGMCAVASVAGSLISVIVFLIISHAVLSIYAVTISNSFKMTLFLILVVCLLVFYNRQHKFLNLSIMLIGAVAGLIGESSVLNRSYFSFGIDDLELGLGLLPVISGLLVVPALNQQFSRSSIKKIPKITIIKPLVAVIKHKTSVIRGAIIGMVCGIVPGVSTVLSTNASYTYESTLHSTNPSKKIIASETANNSGQFSSMLPLLLFGIPITGSEIVLYDMLVSAGWEPNQLGNIDKNVNLVVSLLPWFVLINIMGLILSWPLSKHLMVIYRIPLPVLSFCIAGLIIAINYYVGSMQLRESSYLLQLSVFSIIGYALKKHNLLPFIFMFLIASELEGIMYRFVLLNF
jgi:putative tricarboxylic transport membrane protein